MSTFAWVIIALIAGGALGAGAVWFFAVRRAGPMSVIELKKENERFREEVNAHFVQSAQLINELTDSYKKVFDHLSDGAERLVDSDTVRERMPQVGRGEVRLRHIGAPKDFSSRSDAKMETGAAQPVKPASTRPDSRSEPPKSETSKSQSSKNESSRNEGSKLKTDQGRSVGPESQSAKD